MKTVDDSDCGGSGHYLEAALRVADILQAQDEEIEMKAVHQEVPKLSPRHHRRTRH